MVTIVGTFANTRLGDAVSVGSIPPTRNEQLPRSKDEGERNESEEPLRNVSISNYQGLPRIVLGVLLRHMTSDAADLPDVGLASLHSSLVETLEHVPRAARWVLPAWAAAFMGTEASTVEPKVRALMLIRIASHDRSTYWRTQLETIVEDAGVTPDELTLVESDEWETAPAFTDRERAAILWGDRIARRLARRDKRAYETLRESFSEKELVELTMVASLAAMADRFTNALRIAPEPPIGLSPSPNPASEDVLSAWSVRMFDVASNNWEEGK